MVNNLAQQTSWPAPAKINLFLHIVGKRADGYHLLQTVFQFLDFGDELIFHITATPEISRSYDLGFSEESDLCLRAARLLQKECKIRQGVRIDLSKRLPMGGGLGGGSSNAATVLIALNRLWNCNLSRTRLAELGLSLGADVPVFVEGRAAWADGIGEQLTPIDLAEPYYLVLIPNVSVSTAQIFSNKGLTEGTQMKKIRALESGVDSTFGENQLEPIVKAEYPQVAALLDWLNQFGPARMSGSGGSVFLPLTSREQGEAILANKPDDTDGFVAKGVNVHPLYQPD